MIPSYQPQAERHIYRLSDGLDHHRRDYGVFEVRSNGSQVHTFCDFSTAALYYLRCPKAAAIYDVTEEEILIERKIHVLLS